MEQVMSRRRLSDLQGGCMAAHQIRRCEVVDRLRRLDVRHGRRQRVQLGCPDPRVRSAGWSRRHLSKVALPRRCRPQLPRELVDGESHRHSAGRVWDEVEPARDGIVDCRARGSHTVWQVGADGHVADSPAFPLVLSLPNGDHSSGVFRRRHTLELPGETPFPALARRSAHDCNASRPRPRE